MKTLVLALSIAATLAGCAVVPYGYGPPGVYAPAVVVPYAGYYRGGYGYGYRGYR